VILHNQGAAKRSIVQCEWPHCGAKFWPRGVIEGDRLLRIHAARQGWSYGGIGDFCPLHDPAVKEQR